MHEKRFYNGLYGEDSISLVRDVIYISPINQRGHIKPHAHSNLFQIFLIEKGKVKLTVNDEIEEIDPLSFFTVPKNVFHGLEMAPETTGWLITVSDIALERMLSLDTKIMFTMDEIHIGKLKEQNPPYENLYVTMHKCIAEFNNHLLAREFALEYLVGMLLIRLYRIPREELKLLKAEDHTYNLYYRSFLHGIKESHQFNKSVRSYAEELKISAGHLNRICQTISEKSPKQLIHDYFLSESKKHLTDFKQSISQISLALGFEDANYFTRFFRQKTGISPREYRKSLGAH